MSSIFETARDPALFLLCALAISSTCIWFLTGLIIVVWRRASAAIRHRLWGMSMLAVLIAPVLIAVLPIPRWTRWDQSWTKVSVATERQSLPKLEDTFKPAAQPTSAVIESPNDQSRPQIIPSEIKFSGENSVPETTANGDTNVLDRNETIIPARIAVAPAVGATQTFAINDALGVIVCLWAIGMAISASLLAFSLRRISGWLHTAIAIESGAEFERCRALCRQLSMTRPIRLLMSPETLVPFLSGVWRPILVLPTGFGQWSSDRLNVVLSHELIHARRGDVLWQIAGRLCLIPLWFHPLGWIAAWRLRVECEHACDDAVLLNGTTPCDYAEHLVEIASRIQQRSQPLPPHVVAMAKRSPVEQRVRSILDPSISRQPVGRTRSLCVTFGMAAAILILATVTPSHSESKPPVQAAKGQNPAEENVEPKSDSSDSSAKRIEQALNAPTTVDFKQGTPLLEVLSSLAFQHKLSMTFDEVNYVNREILHETIPAFRVKNAKLRDVLNDVTASIFRPRNLKLELKASHGILLLAVQGNAPANENVAENLLVKRISGTLRNAAGEPIKGNPVQIRNRFRTSFAVTDDTGRFAIETEFERQWWLIVSAKDQTADDMAGWSFSPSWEGPMPEIPAIDLTMKPPKSITVQVMDGKNAAVSQATVGVFTADGDSLKEMTNENGQARFLMPADIDISHIFAVAASKGADYVSYVDRRRYSEPDRKPPAQPEGVVQLRLTGSKKITLNVRDEDGNPVAGIRFYPWYLQKPDDPKSDFNLSMTRRFGRETTNREGTVVFDWIPIWESRQGIIQFWHESQDYIHRRAMYDPKKSANGSVDFTLQKFVPASGRVVDPNGDPVAGATVDATGAGYDHDNCRTSTTTDADGKYSLKLYPHQIFMLLAASGDQRQMGMREGLLVYPGQPLTRMDIELKPATRVFGRVTIGNKAMPVKEQQIHVYQYGKDLHQFKDANFPNPDDSRSWVSPTKVHYTKTDVDGKFEFHLSAGKFDIRGPEQSGIPKFNITDEPQLEFNFHTDRPEKGPFRGKVVTGDPPQPVADATIEFTARSTFGDHVKATTDENGGFHVVRKLFPAVLYARNNDRSLASLTEFGPDDTEGTVQIFPTATYTARIVDQQDQPLPKGRIIQYGVKVHMGDKSAPWMTSYGGNAVVEDDGRVTFKNMVVGAPYDVNLEGLDKRSWHGITEFTPESAEPKDLGNLSLKKKE